MKALDTLKRFKRIILIVIDSVGIGALPDAGDYGDEGANTLKNLSYAVGGINLPVLESLGLGNICDIKGVPPKKEPRAYCVKALEKSVGKDTTTGHWEMMGLLTEKPFKVFTDTGFPQELIDLLSEKTGRKYIGNKSASGTEIISELGERQIETGEVILYTSADSVLQLAANKNVIPLDELYSMCEIAREITMREDWMVARVIARPFVGTGRDNFKRTSERHDYSVEPFSITVLDVLKENGFDVISVGKISDIFAARGVTESHPIPSNRAGMEKILSICCERDFNGMLFANLVDFDALYGHRRDPEGYKKALVEFDEDLGKLIPQLKNGDLLIITADHGNDPTHTGTDHTREAVPAIFYNKEFNNKREPLNDLESFADIGITVLENFLPNFEMEKTFKIGESLLTSLCKHL